VATAATVPVGVGAAAPSRCGLGVVLVMTIKRGAPKTLVIFAVGLAWCHTCRVVSSPCSCLS
jgi:hypothetical protein